jgi:hydroxymethylpyrimidine/phosphomethylpyrimidine kinase
MDSTTPNVLIISASDPTSGAGMQADIQTISSLGCHPLSVLTGLTVQDTNGVHNVSPVESKLFTAQAQTILDDSKVDLIKCGMLSSEENIRVLAKLLNEYPNIPVVLDPIMASGRGDELTSESMRQLMIELILPRVTLLTPNIMEARQLVKLDDQVKEISIDEAAKRLLVSGCENVLITGTHDATNDVVNKFYLSDGETESYAWKRLPHEYHGSGCTLASAIAAYVAQGLSLKQAVEEGQDFTWHTLESAIQTGQGQRIPNRFFWMNDFDDSDDDPTHH